MAEEGPSGSANRRDGAAFGGYFRQTGLHLSAKGLSLLMVAFVLQGLHYPRQEGLHFAEETAATVKPQGLLAPLQGKVYLTRLQVTARGL